MPTEGTNSFFAVLLPLAEHSFFIDRFFIDGGPMFKEQFDNLRKNGALVHNITNYVTVNDVANVILACGASPIMSDDIDEVEEITSICGGLNINIGTLNQRTVSSMIAAGKKSNLLGHKVVLDPVGAGASTLRTAAAKSLLSEVKFDVIKGNISEIKTLATGSNTTCGVDANIKDAVTGENLESTVNFAKTFSKKAGSIIAITGEIDIVADSHRCFIIRNGLKEMGMITGTGCQLSGLITAFLIANPETPLRAAAAAVCAMGLAGETGYNNMQGGDGNSTYKNRIIDAIYNMNGETLEKGAKYEIM